MRHSNSGSRAARTLTYLVALAAGLITAALAIAPPKPPTPGLVGRYFASPDWTGTPILERIDTSLSTETLLPTPELARRDVFSVEWTGALIVRRDGIYPFATKSDDGSLLWIDEKLVVDNGGAHSTRNVAADVPLARGVHPFRLRYSQQGGGIFLQVGQVDALAQMRHPAPLISEHTTYARLRVRELWPLALVALWYATALLLLARLWPLVRSWPVLSDVAEIWTDGRLRVLVLLAAAICAAHIGYGLPAVPSFSADELEPLDTLAASRSGFADWNLRWPPLQGFLLAGLLQPFAWAEALYHLPLSDDLVIATMFVVARSSSVALVALALLFTFEAARLIAGRTAGYFAVTLLAGSPLVVFFGSLANLEASHLFWMSFALWSLVKLWQHGDTRRFAVAGLAIGLGVANKDQAYGYFVAAPVLFVWCARQPHNTPRRSLLAALTDRRIAVALLMTGLAFVLGHALPWQWQRFVNRIDVLTGVSSVPFRMFEPTLAGQVELLITSLKAFVWAAGLPLAAAAIAGFAVWMRQGRARLVFALVTPLVTYYFTFLFVILYVYDRFLIGWLPVAAISGGAFLAHATSWRIGAPVAGRAIATLFVGVTALNAVAVNVVFQRDPIHSAWRWVQTHMTCGSSVGVVLSSRYVPPLHCFDVWVLQASGLEAMSRKPRYLVLNAAYLRRVAGTPGGRRFFTQLASGALGYERQARFESRPPRWAPLYWEARFSNDREDEATIADKPLHAIEVWECVRRESCLAAP